MRNDCLEKDIVEKRRVEKSRVDQNTPFPPLPDGPPETPSADPKPTSRGKPRLDVVEAFEHWRSALGKSKAAKLDDKRRKRLEWAIDAYGLDAVKRCIDGYAGSAWHRGANDRQRPFDGIELWFRDAEHVEAGIELPVGGSVRTGARLTPAVIDDATAEESRRRSDELWGGDVQWMS